MGLSWETYLIVLAANGGAVNIAVGSHEADRGEEGRDGLHVEVGCKGYGNKNGI
jgi:hypothetical protein